MIVFGGKLMEDSPMTDLLLRPVALMLDRLNEHDPESGYLFAVDQGLTDYLTMLTLVHACATNAVPMARALETIERMEERHDARLTGDC